MTRLLIFAIASSVALLAGMQLQDQEQQDDTKNRIVRPVIDDDAVERRDFMRTKLLIAQNILEGLTIGDHDLVNRGIDDVKDITKAASWVAIDDDTYRKLTDDFNTTIERLEKAAKTKNLDAIALRFYEMSTSCIDCHKHVREAAYEL